MTTTKIVDTDIHNVVDRDRIQDFLPEPWKRRWASGNSGGYGVAYWNPNGVMRADAVTADGSRIERSPSALVEEFLEPHNISHGVLNPGATGFSTSPELDYVSAICSANNDVTMHDWLPVDDRLLGSIVVCPNDPQQAAREIHRAAEHPRMVQVLFGSGLRIPLGQRFYDPLFEAAAQHNLPVAIHPGNEGTGIAYAPTPAGFPSNYLEWHTNLASNFIAHMVSLLVEGTFVKFPNLKVALLEGGVSWVAPILWRLDKNWKALRQTVPWLTRLPSEYATDHIRLSTQSIEEPENSEHFKQILNMFAADRMLMFSSDFPHWDGDTPDFAARQFPREMRSRVMSENALELYHLV